MDTGWNLIKQEKSADLAITCECQNKAKVKTDWKRAGLNLEMSKHSFTNYEEWNQSSKIAKDIAVAYYRAFGMVKSNRQNSIMFCGQVGSGKTHLSVALAVNLLAKDIKVIYMPYRDIITNIKQNMLDAEYYCRTIAKYKVCEVLLIDDLFKGKITESDINIMFEIINYRYLNYLPIIVSSEFTLDKLLNFDQAIGSRIYEMCKRYAVEIEHNTDNNYRLK